MYASATLFIAEAAAQYYKATAGTLDPKKSHIKGYDEHPDWCGSWTFNNMTPPKWDEWPLVTDCEELVRYLENTQRVYWHVLPRAAGTKKRYGMLESSGSCAFGARLTAGKGVVKLARTDMINLMKRSLREYTQEDGRVAAWGKGICRGENMFVENEISWLILNRDTYLITFWSIPILERPEGDW